MARSTLFLALGTAFLFLFQNCGQLASVTPQGTLETSPQMALTGTLLNSSAKSPLRVDTNSKVIVMGYEPWFGPKGKLFGSSLPHYPQLTSSNMPNGYDSSDPAVIRQHSQWLEEAGVHAILLDHSNGIPCTFGDTTFCTSTTEHEHFAAIRENVRAMYQNLSSNGSRLKIIPLLGAEDARAFSLNADGQSNFEKQVNFFADLMALYSNLNVIYENKPLINIFVGPSPSTAMGSNWQKVKALLDTKYAGRFTYRVVAGYIGQQPDLRKSGLSQIYESRYPLWNWLERLKPELGILPAYTMNSSGSRVEAFTVQLTSPPMHVSSIGEWKVNGTYNSEIALRNNGVTLKRFMGTAQNLQPIFLLINQWNCFDYGADGGVDFETTNDFEPDREHGDANLQLLKQVLSLYASNTPDPTGEYTISVPVPPPTSATNTATLSVGVYRVSTGLVVASNGQDRCGFATPQGFTDLTGMTSVAELREISQTQLSGTPGIGPCSDASNFAKPGLFMTENGAVYNSNGQAYCSFTSPQHFTNLTHLTTTAGISVRANLPSRLRFDGPCN